MFSAYLIINNKYILRVQYETASVSFSIPIRMLNYAHAFTMLLVYLYFYSHLFCTKNIRFAT